MPQSRAIATRTQRGGSWMLPKAKGQDLLYAPGGCGGTCVLSASAGDLVGSLNEAGDAVCSDKVGNVFLVQNNDVLEYPHGGSSPIATLSLPGNEGSACSVDPSTGDLAVVFKGSGDDVAVFPRASGVPTLFGSQIDSLFCGFDQNGNLFVDGYSGEDYALSMLPKGSATFSMLSINRSMGQPGQLQWDGKYMTYQNRIRPLQVSRFAVSGSTVSVVGATKFGDLRSKHVVLSWIHGDRIFIPYPNHGVEAKQLGEWKYPKGGKQTTRFDFGSYQKTLILQGVTYSATGNK